jgi:DNA recombination protein RmuC
MLRRGLYIAIPALTDVLLSFTLKSAVGMEGIMPGTSFELVLLLGVAALAGVGALFAALCFFRMRPQAVALTEQTAGRILRSETDIVRAVVEDQARGLRQELGRTLTGFQEVTLKAFGTLGDGIDVQIRTFGERLDHGVKATDESVTAISTKLTLDMEQMRAEANTGRENLRGLIEQKLDQNIAQQFDSAKVLREELGGNFERLGIRVTESLAETGRMQLERLENVTTALGVLAEKSEKAQESLRLTVEGRLDAIRQDNAIKLDEMRQTVDEKLQGTLEQRLGASFKLVSDQLEQVFRGIGEMQSLATGVGDLKKMLSNVKMRGAWGEVSLGNLLDQVLTVDQYDRNVEVKPGSNQRVEYAIKLPGGDDGDGPLWLPIDAKFPNEDYERLVDASDRGDVEAVEAASKAVEMRIRASAKDICDKYVHPPHSTDFAVLFLPTEGLFAEIIRRPGLVDALQRECRIVVTGPTTLMALLNSLRMGFRTLAIQKRSSEVWQVLAAVKTEFGKYGEVLDKVQQKLHEASNTIDKVSVRRRAIDRRLRGVEILPEMEAGAILSLPGGNGFDSSEDSTDPDTSEN